VGYEKLFMSDMKQDWQLFSLTTGFKMLERFVS
jgi:hypothetical protein